MWFIKSDLQKQIIKYGKDRDILEKLARFSKRTTIEAISLDDIKAFYIAHVEPINGTWEKLYIMKALRKFFREYRGENVLKWQEITDNPLQAVVESATIFTMKKQKESKVGRPPNVEMIKKVKLLREDAKLSFRKIGAAIGKDSRQAFMWYEASKKLKAPL